jgi:transcriptional regulator with XRE-family HTH domain
MHYIAYFISKLNLNGITLNTKCNIMQLTSIYDQLRQRRETLGVTQIKLAELSGVGIRTINLIESGTHNASIDTINKLASVLGMELKLEIRQLNA